MRVTPTLHRDYKIGERVWFDAGDGREIHGEIAGVALAQAIFHYIILLNEPIDVPEYDEKWKCVTIPGGMLRSLLDSMR